MFLKDIEYISSPVAQENLLCLIYANNTIAECCAVLNINPAALAYARRNDAKLDNEIRQAQSVLMDMAVEVLPTIHENIENPLMARVVSDNIKWLASKRAKDVYGDKVDVNVTHTLDLREAIAAAQSRRLQFVDGKALIINEDTTDNKTVECIDVPDLDALDVFA
jgi:hypothetical protein